MATKQIAGLAEDIPTIMVPQYYESLQGKPFVGFYSNGAASVIVSCEDSADLNAAGDVLKIDPAALDTVADPNSLDTLSSFNGTVSQGPGLSKGVVATIDGSKPAAYAQSFRDPLQQLNNGSPIVLNSGDGLAV